MFGLFQVIDGPDGGRKFTLRDGQTLRIGRGPETDTQLQDPAVSRLHCEVNMIVNKALLKDAGSAAGTWVNGERVTECKLMPGDVIRMGNTKLTFLWSTLDESQTMPETKVKNLTG